MINLAKQKHKKVFISICPVCGKQETDPDILFCVNCSDKMRLHDGTNTCDKCGKNHDQKVIYKKKRFFVMS